MTNKWTTFLLASVLASPFTYVPAQSNDRAPAASSAVESSGFRPEISPSAKDNGRPVDGSAILHMRFVFSRSADQQNALDTFEREILDPSSPNYKKWMTPEKYGSLYGPGRPEIETAVAWLQAKGFTVGAVPPARTDLAFSGTVHQAEEAFQTSLRSYLYGGKQFYAPASDPVIPDSLKGTVAGIAGLSTSRFTAAHAAGPRLAYRPDSGRWEFTDARNASPNKTAAGFTFLAVTPSDAATIYNAPNPVLNANTTSGEFYTGRGVTIGIVSDAAVRASTIATYRARFLGDDHVLPTVTEVDEVSAIQDSDQAYIDTELAGAMAPGASLHVYTAADLFEAIESALSENAVDILVVGFSSCAYAAGDERLVKEWWMQAAAQGIAVTVPARSLSGSCNLFADQVNAFAATPFNIAVAGTDTESLASNFSSYVNSTSSAARFYGFAKAYIPETPWIDAPAAESGVSATIENESISDVGHHPAGSNTLNCGTLGVLQICEQEAKPLWQHGDGVPADHSRDVPDVSLLAGQGAYGTAWAVCTDDSVLHQSAPDCVMQKDGSFSVHTFGGTSTAASAFAGILALVQEKTGGRLGQAAKEIYGLYNGAHRAKIFHQSGSPNSSLPVGADASNGYDKSTGLGSVNIEELLKYWGTAVGSGTATVAVTPSATTLTSVAGLTVSVTVTGSGSLGTPTGTVVLQSGTFNSGTQTLSSGSFSFHIAPGTLAVGTDTLTVSYSGDSNYGTATGAATVTVTQTTPTVTVTPSTHTLNSNATLNVVAAVTGASGVLPTGTVTLSGGGYTSSPQALMNGIYSFAVPAYSLTAGSDVLSVSYGGDANFGVATGSTTVTVTKSAFTLAATDLTITAGATSNNASHVTVTPIGSYTGTVTLTAAVTASPAGAVSVPTFTGTSVTISSGPATGFITVATTPVPAARLGFLARANGWFRAAGGTALAAILFWLLPGQTRRRRVGMSVVLLSFVGTFLAMGCGGGSTKTSTVTVKPGQASIKASDALSVAITVAGTGSATPTGTVTLTSGTFSTSGSLSGGSSTVSIPANTLTPGQSNTLTANYSGDAHYLPANGSATVSVLAPGTTAGTYTVTITGTGNDAGNTTATASFTLTVK